MAEHGEILQVYVSKETRNLMDRLAAYHPDWTIQRMSESAIEEAVSRAALEAGIK